MDLSIRRFGGPSREVVGVLQRARAGLPRRGGFLLCRPLGQEAVRTASMYRALADRLAREGCDVLRFDYHGTGDSPGEEGDQSLAGFVDDTLGAHAELEADGAPVLWFGMGLGAMIALRAAARAKVAPRHVVLWEPVHDGKAYLRTLLDAHRAELAREFNQPWEQLLAARKVDEPRVPGDVLGFEIGAVLTAELEKLDELPVAAALRRGVRVTCAVHAEAMPRFAALADNPAFSLHEVETRTDWMSSQAMGTAIVPRDVPPTLLRALEDGA